MQGAAPEGLLKRRGDFVTGDFGQRVSTPPADQFPDLVVAPEKKENQFTLRNHDHERQAIVQTHTALVNGLAQTPDAHARVRMRIPPRLQHTVHSRADLTTLALAAGTNLFPQLLSDAYAP